LEKQNINTNDNISYHGMNVSFKNGHEKRMLALKYVLAMLLALTSVLAVLKPEAFLVALLIVASPFIFAAMLLGRRGLTAVIITLMLVTFIGYLLRRREVEEWIEERWRRR
jgi:uncharacterized membrane protein YccC